MDWKKLEDRFTPFAVPHLLRYVAALNLLAFVLCTLRPEFRAALVLKPAAVLKGELWRLIFHVFAPEPGMSWLGAALRFLWLIWIGDGLEQVFGRVRLNLYYLVGVMGVTAAMWLGDAGAGILGVSFCLQSSLFLAFAWFYPREEVWLFPFIRLQVRWLAVLDVVLLAVQSLGMPWPERWVVISAFINYALFFLPQWAFRGVEDVQARSRRQKFEAAREPESTLHQCVLCGRTEVSHPDLEFRVSGDGSEYCSEHLPSRRPPQEASGG
jgi:hypothetical protein